MFLRRIPRDDKARLLVQKSFLSAYAPRMIHAGIFFGVGDFPSSASVQRGIFQYSAPIARAASDGVNGAPAHMPQIELRP